MMSSYLIYAAIILSVFILFAAFRVMVGKNTSERVVALDIINTLVIITMIVLGAHFRKALYIDIGIVYGILSFIGTLYIAKYIREEKER